MGVETSETNTCSVISFPGCIAHTRMHNPEGERNKFPNSSCKIVRSGAHGGPRSKRSTPVYTRIAHRLAAISIDTNPTVHVLKLRICLISPRRGQLQPAQGIALVVPHGFARRWEI